MVRKYRGVTMAEVLGQKPKPKPVPKPVPPKPKPVPKPVPPKPKPQFQVTGKLPPDRGPIPGRYPKPAPKAKFQREPGGLTPPRGPIPGKFPGPGAPEPVRRPKPTGLKPKSEQSLRLAWLTRMADRGFSQKQIDEIVPRKPWLHKQPWYR